MGCLSHSVPEVALSANPPPITRDLPRVGALATVRNRRGVIGAVELYSSHKGDLHLVTMEYLDADGPLEDQ